jgi:hypothetical protein
MNLDTLRKYWMTAPGATVGIEWGAVAPGAKVVQ